MDLFSGPYPPFSPISATALTFHPWLWALSSLCSSKHRASHGVFSFSKLCMSITNYFCHHLAKTQVHSHWSDLSYSLKTPFSFYRGNPLPMRFRLSLPHLCGSQSMRFRLSLPHLYGSQSSRREFHQLGNCQGPLSMTGLSYFSVNAIHA